MLAVTLVAPFALMGLLLALGWLEDAVVAPIDRAARIGRLLETAPAEEIERSVAEFLAPVAPRRPPSPA